MSANSLTVGPPHQDYIVLGGQVSPGYAVPRGFGIPREYEIRKAYGDTGAVGVFKGQDLSKFSVDVYLWDDSQWDDWDRFANLLEKPPAPPPVLRPGNSAPVRSAYALDILHPRVNRSPYRIKSVVVVDVLDQGEDDYGLWKFEIQLLQYLPPKQVLAKPVASTPGVKTTPPNVVTATDIKLANIDAQILVKQAQDAALGRSR